MFSPSDGFYGLEEMGWLKVIMDKCPKGYESKMTLLTRSRMQKRASIVAVAGRESLAQK